MAQPSSAISAQSIDLTARRKRGQVRLLLVSMRPHQWVKNLFVFAPLLFGRRLGDIGSVIQCVLAFVSFCLLSSSLYIINDVVDASSDRAHVEKRHRPLASGELSVAPALIASLILVFASLWIASIVSTQFLFLAAIYGVLTLGYSLVWKHSIVLDGMSIATGFVLRVVGGAIAVQVAPTHWLVACAFLLSLYLAFAKRRQELLMLSESAVEHRFVLGQYTVKYLDQVNTLLIGATIVCYTLYTVAPETMERFGTDKLIYGTVFVIYGLLRYLALTQDASRGGNPGRLLLRDIPLLITIAGWASYNALIIYRGSLSAIWARLH